MIVGLIICGCHYLRYPIILKILTDSNAQQVPLTFETTRCLTVGLWEELLSPPIFILLVIGAIWFILKYKNKYNKFLLLLWFFIPYLAILLMKHFKSVEYCLGFVPALILIVSIFLSDINKKIKKKVVISIVIILLIQYVDFSYTKNINMFYEPIRIFKHDIYYYRIKATDFKKEYVVVNKDIIDFLKKFYPDCTVGVPDIFVVGTDISIKVPLILYDIDYCDIEIFKNIATLDVETISENIIQKDIIIFFNNPLEEKEKKELVKIYTYFSMCSNAWQRGTFFYKYSEDAINKLNIILKTIEENYYILYKSGHTVVFKKR